MLDSGHLDSPAEHPKMRTNAHFWNMRTPISAIPYLQHIHRAVKRGQNRNMSFIINNKEIIFQNVREWHSPCTIYWDRLSLAVVDKRFPFCDPRGCSLTFNSSSLTISVFCSYLRIGPTPNIPRR